ncbi:hypothetical protein ACGF3B_22330, partial [Streptomyces sp. NPDC047999]
GCLEIGHVRFGRRLGETHWWKHQQGAPSRPHQLAEHASHSTPDGLQHLLSCVRWNPDNIRDDLQAYIAEAATHRSWRQGSEVGFLTLRAELR